ncbi:MAG: signal peptide peptidase SppA [Thermoanaerobaculia bacterium]
MKKLLAIFLLLLGLAVAIAVGAIALAGRSAPSLGTARVLALKLDEPLVDYAPEPRLPFVRIAPRQSLATIYRAVRRARRDDGIKGLALYIQDASMGLAQAQELRRLVASLAAAGKRVACYLEGAGEGSNGTLDYFLATACPRIALTPASDVNLLGLLADSAFLRGTLDKLKIEPNFHHVGDYKSASETYTETEHSPAAEEALAALLDDFYAQIVAAVAESRRLSASQVRELVDGAPYTADRALALGLVDELAYPDEFEARLLEEAGGATLLELDDYGGPPRRGRRLAVVFAQGVIVRGEGGLEPWSQQRYLGSDDLAETLSRLAEDSAVAAVVLRIDSPGGSALASELMLRAVVRLTEAKPIVVSMSSLAASGGYYIAARTTKIVAEPGTLTGSIGVVGGKLVTRRFQQELLGISHDALARGANADFYSTLTPFDPDQEERFRTQMEAVYRRFVGHVAEGRGLSPAAVEELARGRIWSGERARELGLVDEIGGLDRALELAAEAAGVPLAELGVAYYPEPPSWLEILEGRRTLATRSPLAALEAALAPHAPQLLELPAELARLAEPF